MFDWLADHEGANRRSSARTPLYMLVEARNLKYPLWAFDLSLGGLRCVSDQPLWPGTYLDLSFCLPDSHEPLVTGAQVVALDTADTLDTFTNPGAKELLLGLRFCCMADGARMAIYRFLDRRRRLWDKEVAAREEGSLSARYPHLAHLFDAPAPFANLMAETYEALGLPLPRRDDRVS